MEFNFVDTSEGHVTRYTTFLLDIGTWSGVYFIKFYKETWEESNGRTSTWKEDPRMLLSLSL